MKKFKPLILALFVLALGACGTEGSFENQTLREIPERLERPRNDHPMIFADDSGVCSDGFVWCWSGDGVSTIGDCSCGGSPPA